MKWPSDGTHWAHKRASISPLFHPLLCLAFCGSLSEIREEAEIDRWSALEGGETTQFGSPHSRIFLLVHFPQGQDSLISTGEGWRPCRERRPRDFEVWCPDDWPADWLSLELIDYLTGCDWLIDLMHDCLNGWLADWLTGEGAGTKPRERTEQQNSLLLLFSSTLLQQLVLPARWAVCSRPRLA